MCKFISLIIDRQNRIFKNSEHLSNVSFLYLRYEKFLNDDYAPNATYSAILDLIERTSPFFFVILTDNNEFAGFVYLDNLIGNEKILHCAEVSACFEKNFWGKFTKTTALEFFKYCFDVLKLKKLKAQIYPFNNRVRAILKFTGFQKDGILRAETMKFGKLADIEVYSLLKSDLKYAEISPE